MRYLSYILPALLVLTASAVIGCDATGYMLYLFAPGDKMVKVPAEFDGFAGKKVAIVIYADICVQYDYPFARLGLSTAIASELKAHVENIEIVPPARVVAFQDQNVNWETMDRTELGRELGADYVLYVMLDEYTLREPGSVNLFRGRVRAQAVVYDCLKNESDARVWSGDEFSVIYPEHAPTGQLGQDDSRIRYETEKRFAMQLAKRFYEHEVPKQP